MKTITTLFIITFACMLKAQGNILEKYLAEGFNNNLALKQKNISISKSLSALKEAKGLFYPSIDFRSDLNYSDGGRKIDFPAGDMLNPVYSTLNRITQSSNFPSLQNQHIQLLPDDYHDTRFELKLPLFNTDIWYNNEIKKEEIIQKEAEAETYKRELTKEIKTAYYNYLKTIKVISIYRNALNLYNENYTLTESLVKNNIALKSNLLKITADINKAEASVTEAVNSNKIAASYFNFLLNKPFNEPIAEDTLLFDSLSESKELDNVSGYTANNREELLQLKSGINQAEYLKEMKKAKFLPTLGAFAAAGYQGTKYKFDSNQRYYLLGLQLNWNLFNGMQTSSSIEQTEYELTSLNTLLDETEKKLTLQVSNAVYNLKIAKAKLKSTAANLNYSQEYYRQIRLRYASGQALIIELSDALTQHVNNQMLYQLAAADVLIKKAELERAAAANIFNVK